MFVADPALMLLLILLIGIAVGLLMYRYAGSRWLMQFTSTRRGYLTSALVGVAGSFTGYHLATIAAALVVDSDSIRQTGGIVFNQEE